MRHARAELLDHLIEVRETDLGAHIVLVDGRVVSRSTFGWFRGGSSHFFDLADAKGATRHVEVEVRGWGMRRTPAYVLIDGAEAAELGLESRRRTARQCPHCRYPLAGLPVENDEVRCPECGRHIAIVVLGLERGTRTIPGQMRGAGA
nr:hypothetical protein [uncultured bacterium]